MFVKGIHVCREAIGSLEYFATKLTRCLPTGKMPIYNVPA